jgi:polyhydroxyalkanoate synthesis repressor PhaR
MVRLVKRYGGGSRKLYDTEESRYVSLEEIAGWVRDGQHLRVVDSKTGEDETAQTLAQVIYEGERKGISLVPTEILHEVIRRGERAFQRRVGQLQEGVDRLVRAGVDKVKPLQEARVEMASLRDRLEQLERSLAALEAKPGAGRDGSPGNGREGRGGKREKAGRGARGGGE